jgi:energy-coupling factor transporter ATP-binding protein EcfA2
MNIILFGPPGVGKSTLIGTLKTLGKRAIDLEDLYPNRIRFQVPNLVDNVYIGAADLAPSRQYRNALKVLLVMDQDKYDARRSARDKQQPGKAAQSRHLMEDWMTAKYDYLLRADAGDPEQVARTLISFVDGRER